jgi:hypothetical protein
MTTKPARMGCWHVDGPITPGSARVVIEGDSFGTRYLGGEEFIVFRDIDQARTEARRVLADMPQLSGYEIHQFSSTGEWYTVGAGSQLPKVAE